MSRTSFREFVRLIEYDDKTKIQILKTTNILTVSALIVTNVAGKIVLAEYEKQKKKRLFEARILKRYSELASDEVNQQIYEEFAFEWVTSGLDVPKFPKEE